METGTCRLCGTQGKLCQSHIVPEFCYQYDVSGSARRVLAAEILDDGSVKEWTEQKGYREYLLCSGCEQILCKHENQFAKFWASSPELRGQLQPGPLELHGLDYHAVKSLVLSVFWRASVSTEFGKEMQLGTYSEKLRAVLLNGTPIPQDHYPILGRVILGSDGCPLHGLISRPKKMWLGEVEWYCMAFAGCLWNVIMSTTGLPAPFNTMQDHLTKSGTIRLVAEPYDRIPPVAALLEAIRQM